MRSQKSVQNHSPPIIYHPFPLLFIITASCNYYPLVVVRVVRISQIEDNSRVRPAAATLRELSQEVDAAVEAQAAIFKDVNPLRLEVRRSVNNADIPSLDEVVGDKQVLLIRADLDVVRTDNALLAIGVIEALNVVEIRDIESGDVVADCERKVSELAVVGDVRVDGEVVAGAGTKVEEELGNTLLAIRVLAERVDDPDLTGADGGGKSSGLGVAGNELDVLDTSAVGDGDGADDLARAEFPETEGVGLLNAVDAGGFEDGDWDDEVRGQDDVLLEIDAEAVRAELLAKDVQGRGHIFRPLVDDVELSIGLDETAWGRADCGAHVGDEEATIGLCADLIRDGREQSAVGLLELRLVGVGSVEVVGRVLSGSAWCII